MTRKDLLNFCRIYKGQKNCPYEGGDNPRKHIWFYERGWYLLHTDDAHTQENKDTLARYLDDYIRAGLATFENMDGVPIDLKAYLLSIYSSKTELPDIKGFETWYKEQYMKLKP